MILAAEEISRLAEGDKRETEVEKLKSKNGKGNGSCVPYAKSHLKYEGKDLISEREQDCRV